MPRIFEYKCNKCDLVFPKGAGGYTYVTDDKGKRIVCPHPRELYTISKVLNKPESRKLFEDERVGYSHYCICLDCLKQFALDPKKDKRICPNCSSTQVKTISELIGKSCPKCKSGTIVQIDTGIIS